MVYTQNALAGATSKDAMEADIYLAVDQSNRSYIHSNIDQRLRLVHIAEVSYAEPSPPDEIATGCRTRRTVTWTTCLVVMITETGSYCGYSFTMDPVGSLRGPRIRRGGTEMRNASRRIQFRA